MIMGPGYEWTPPRGPASTSSWSSAGDSHQGGHIDLSVETIRVPEVVPERTGAHSLPGA
jgi:hypothetical protein